MTDLTQALVELRRVTPPSSPWEAGDFGVGSSPVDYHIATILNAVLSGDLIPVQCCMCGKTGLSIREGDGGPECQLDDGRWTCSRECWDRATGDLIPRADADLAELATLRAQVERLTGALKHEVKRGRRHLAKDTLDTLAALTEGAALEAHEKTLPTDQG